MLSSLLSIASGGATGLLGSLFSRFFDFLSIKEKNKLQVKVNQFELLKMDKEKEFLQMEIDKDVVVAKTEANAKMEIAATEALAQSYQADKAAYIPEGTKLGPFSTFMLVIVDFTRGLIRPALTIYLCILATFIYIQSKEMAQGMDVAKAGIIVETCINSLLYLTATSVTWWFGSRPKKN